MEASRVPRKNWSKTLARVSFDVCHRHLVCFSQALSCLLCACDVSGTHDDIDRAQAAHKYRYLLWPDLHPARSSLMYFSISDSQTNSKKIAASDIRCVVDTTAVAWLACSTHITCESCRESIHVVKKEMMKYISLSSLMSEWFEQLTAFFGASKPMLMRILWTESRKWNQFIWISFSDFNWQLSIWMFDFKIKGAIMIRNIQLKIVSISILSRTQLSAAPSVRTHSRCAGRGGNIRRVGTFWSFRVMILS